jgi:hypothetical protein
MIKVPLRESKDKIAKFIQDHYQELVPQDDPRTNPSSGGPLSSSPPSDRPVSGGSLSGSQLANSQLTGSGQV